MTAYYNEIDPFAAEWLRQLIKAGQIAPGEVDERSIELVEPHELLRFSQCHFFAGIGVWSYSLRLAGWPDERPIWTGSCPCQPFSDAGKGEGVDDPRHLWPQFGWLIGECRPELVLGEQVASKNGLAWLDLVQDDLEAEGYAFAAVDMGAAGFGAPHIRQRLWWVGERLDDAAGARRDAAGQGPEDQARDEARLRGPERGRGSRGLVDTGGARLEGHDQHGDGGRQPGRLGAQPAGSIAEAGRADRLADADGQQQRAGRGSGGEGTPRVKPRLEPRRRGGAGGLVDRQLGGTDRGRGLGLADTGGVLAEQPAGEGSGSYRAYRGRASGQPAGRGDAGWLVDTGSIGRSAGRIGHNSGDDRPLVATDGEDDGPGPVNGFWRAADWLFCRDGKWRPVEPGTFPLASGIAGRVGRLRGYGNAINAVAAQVFIETVMESL